jgi:hypothetical protein
MVLDSKPGTPSSPSNAEHPGITTPINMYSRTFYCFGDRYWLAAEHHLALAAEMSPYFVGPMPISAFLEEFFPLPQVVLSFTKGMFSSVLASKDEVRMYKPFVCP